MKTVQQLINIRDEMKRSAAAFDAGLASFRQAENRIRADGTRHEAYIADKIDEARNQALGTLGEPHSRLRDLATEATGQLKFWRSTQFVLSQLRFADDPAADSLIRSRHAAELAAMPCGLVHLVYESARETANLPLVYACWLASNRRVDEAHWVSIDLIGVEIAEQTQALDVIAECIRMPAVAEGVVAEITGRRQPGAEMLARARAMTVPTVLPTLEIDHPASHRELAAT